MLWFCALWNGLKNTKFFVKLLRNFHNCCNIIATVTIIRSWPDCNKISRLKPELESFLDELMGSCNKFNSIDIIKISHNFSPKNPSCSSIIWCPSLNILRIWPHKITERTLILFKSYLNEEFTFFYQWFSSDQWF